MVRFPRWTPRARRALRGLVVAYWAGCLAVIGLGADHLHPEFREALMESAVTWHGDQPFPSCAAAHAAGVYDIPRWSRAYRPEQDRDDDGLACEPPRGSSPRHIGLRLRAP